MRHSGDLSISAAAVGRMDRLEALLAGIDDRWVPTGADAIAQRDRPARGPDRPAEET